MKLFLSYRRDDTQWVADRLFDDLAGRVGRANVFMDIDGIPPGHDFVQTLSDKVAEADVLLVLIGRDWLSVTDAQGQPRLDNPEDFVRVEVEAALARGIPVVPLLVDGAAMPTADQLPPGGLQSLPRMNGDTLARIGFEADVARLADRLGLPARTEEPAKRAGGGRGWIYALGALALVGGGAFALTQFGGMTEAVDPPAMEDDTPTSGAQDTVAAPDPMSDDLERRLRAEGLFMAYQASLEARARFAAAPGDADCNRSTTINFDAGQTALMRAQNDALDDFAARLIDCEITAVLVEGHDDTDRTPRASWTISEDRADAAETAASDLFPPTVILSAAFGAYDLKRETGSGVALVDNRRAEIHVRALPKDEVIEAAYAALGLEDPADRTQPFARILFAYDRADIGPNAKIILDTWAAILAENRDLGILIEGHTGNDGRSQGYARSLSGRQARAAENYLIARGADPRQITVKAWGNDMPEITDPALPDVVRRTANRGLRIVRSDGL